MKTVLAIDIGASSGRHIVGYLDHGVIKEEEIYRFSNGVKEENGHLIWDVDYLFEEVIKGIHEAMKKYTIDSLSIDTWGVDYVLLKGDETVYPVYAYRDTRTLEYIDEVHKRIPFDELYRHTGCQFQSFNSIYQLYTDKKMNRLKDVTDFLMIPEYLMYRLTGVKMKEFTNATTTGLINHETLGFDKEIIQKLGLPEELFPDLNQPGTVLGDLKEEIQKQVGGNCKVILCATHDTGSAVEGIPMEGNELYISSGTWSLLGVKTDKPIADEGSKSANYSNEGGVGYNRYQKNIMGMWLVNELRRELCPNTAFDEIVKMAKTSSIDKTVDAQSSDFLSPKSMKKAFDEHLKMDHLEVKDYFYIAYNSLALGYKKAIEELEKNTGKKYEKLYIVGGGAKNELLNSLTERYTGKKVIALPMEATAIGNLKIQLEEQ